MATGKRRRMKRVLVLFKCAAKMGDRVWTERERERGKKKRREKRPGKQ